VEALAFSPDGELLATASRDMTVRFWNPSTCERAGQAFQLQSPVQAMAFHPKEKLLALGYTDGTVRLLDLATGLPCGPPIKHKHFVTSVAFSKDGKLLASGSFDKTARISHVPDLITDLHEIELRTWVALGARLTES
jgi:WD40 repeat protein